jgi:hypothetical protein
LVPDGAPSSAGLPTVLLNVGTVTVLSIRTSIPVSAGRLNSLPFRAET